MTDLQTIDISAIDQGTAEAVVAAAKTLGFVYITGHSLSPKLLSRIWSLSQDFFSQSDTIKSGADDCFKISDNNRGWSKLRSETLDPATQKEGDYKEAFNISASSEQSLPPPFAAERELFKTFEDECHRICLQLSSLFALGLDLDDPDYFSSRHNKDKKSGSILRLLFYPDSQETVRAGAHTDYGSMTLLFQKPGQSGLEVRIKDTWHSIPPPQVMSTTTTAADDDESMVETPILVNIADQLSLWTGNVLRSTLHRVTSSTFQGPRYSIAYFCHPDDDCELSQIPGLSITSDGDAAEGDSGKTSTSPFTPGITAGEHLRRRLEATYAY